MLLNRKLILFKECSDIFCRKTTKILIQIQWRTSVTLSIGESRERNCVKRSGSDCEWPTVSSNPGSSGLRGESFTKRLDLNQHSSSVHRQPQLSITRIEVVVQIKVEIWSLDGAGRAYGWASEASLQNKVDWNISQSSRWVLNPPQRDVWYEPSGQKTVSDPRPEKDETGATIDPLINTYHSVLFASLQPMSV